MPFTSYADLQNNNHKLAEDLDKLKRENKRLLAENDKERLCRQLDLQKETERLTALFQEEMHAELQAFKVEFDKIKNEILRQKDHFQETTKKCNNSLTVDEEQFQENQRKLANLEEDLTLKNSELEILKHTTESLENKNFSLESDNSRVTIFHF